MGYFSNGTEGTDYEARYCENCIHQNGPEGQSGCAVWLLHLLHNYKECNNPNSMLHVLIPQSKDKLSNERCSMFHPTQEATEREAGQEFLFENPKPLITNEKT